MEICPATAGDLAGIVRLLADDPLGVQRERFEEPLPPAYAAAFDAIARQDGNQVLVAVAGDPAAGDPAAGDPVAGYPAAGDPAAGDPVAGYPAAGDPAAGDPAAGDRVVGCLQLTFIPGLTRLGMTRALIEAVRVDRHHRGQGIGEALFHAAIDLAREAGCRLVQLTTDKTRHDAHRFYRRLGFVASHEGMKLRLEP